jgi:hypothetical protein
MGPAHNGNVFSVLYATGIRKKPSYTWSTDFINTENQKIEFKN